MNAGTETPLGSGNRPEGAVVAILESQAIAGLWAKHHVTRQSAPAPAAQAKQIRAAWDAADMDPSLLSFMIELVGLETKALRKSGNHDDPDVPMLLRNMQDLQRTLRNKAAGVALPPRAKLNEEQKKILDMVENETATKPFQPVMTLLRTMKNTAMHIAGDAKEHPFAFSGLLAASLGTLAFMKARLGSSATLYMDPVATTMTNFSLDTMADPNAPIQTDQALLNMDFQPSCHDHLSQLMGQDAADFVKQTLDMAGMFPAHCSKLKTLADDAQQNLQGSYDFLNSRLELFIKDPTTDIAQRMIPDSPFLNAFNHSAHNTAEFIYALNTVENVVVHTLIFASSVVAAAKLGTMESEEIKALRQDITDYAYRQVRMNPLAVGLATSGSAAAFVMHGGINPDMIWAGLAGVLVGRMIHNGIRCAHAIDFVKASTPGSLSVSRAEADEADPLLMTGENRAGEPHEPRRRTWPDALIKPAIGAGTLTILTTIDALATGGQVSGNVMGTLGVVVPFLAYNVPEDAALHIIFGVAGGIAGAAWAAITKGLKLLRKGFSDNGHRHATTEAGPDDEPS